MAKIPQPMTFSERWDIRAIEDDILEIYPDNLFVSLPEDKLVLLRPNPAFINEN